MAENDVQRLFFGLWPDPAARQRLAALGAALDIPGGRRVHPEDLHLTLQFLGPVPAHRLDQVLGAAAQVTGAPFELLIGRTGYWRRPRIAWCAPLETPPALAALVADLGEQLAPVGYPPERRPYSPHVTLARKARAAPDGPLAEPVRWLATDFALAVSESVPEPPRYRVLQRWPLAGGGQPAAQRG